MQCKLTMPENNKTKTKVVEQTVEFKPIQIPVFLEYKHIFSLQSHPFESLIAILFKTIFILVHNSVYCSRCTQT